MKNPISTILSDNVPLYIKENYTDFHYLIKKLYTWLETDNNPLSVLGSFAQSNEPNREVDYYIDTILQELGWNFNKSLKIKKRFLIHTLRDFYLSRGSENSVNFLFKIFFDSEIEINYPRERLFLLSSTPYITNYYVITTATKYNTQLYKTAIELSKSNNFILKGRKSLSSVLANSLEQININGTNYLKITINDNLNNFYPNEVIDIVFNEDVSVSENILICPTIIITNPGHGYKKGDKIIIDGLDISGLLKIKSVTTGKIDGIEIINGGHGYEINDSILSDKDITGYGFYATVKSVSNEGSITSIEIWNAGYNYTNIQNLIIKSKNGIGAVLKSSSSDIGGIKEIDIIEPYWTLLNINYMIEIQGNGRNGHIELGFQSTISDSTRYFNSINGKLGLNCILHDSLYFQEYYEIKSEISRFHYKDIIEELTHPSGTLFYSRYNNESSISYTLPEYALFSNIKILEKTILVQDASVLYSPENNIEKEKTLSASDFNINTLDYIKFTLNYPISLFSNYKIENILNIAIPVEKN